MAFLLAALLSVVPAAADSQTVSTFTLRLEEIPGGVVLLFSPPEELSRHIDIFRVYRSSKTGVLEGASSVEFNYYHDWYKDYFGTAEIGRHFYYHVEAYDVQGRLIAQSNPMWAHWKPRRPPPTGMNLTPTAYRRVPLYDSPYSGVGRLFPINVDVNASYYIGKLYSHNKLTELTNTRNSLFSRVGVWFLQVDGKVILEREGRYFPQLALGAEGATMMRDTAQPTFQNPGIPAFTVNKERNRMFTSSFLAVGKQFSWLRATWGMTFGDSASKVVYLTEFLAKESITDSGMFLNLDIHLGRRFGFQLEMVKPLGAKASPYLLNFQLGRALHTNFDLAYLKYDRGYDILGHLNFRFTLYPRVASRK